MTDVSTERHDRVVVQVRLSPAERRRWKAAANQMGLTLSQWLRGAANAEANASLPPDGERLAFEPPLADTSHSEIVEPRLYGEHPKVPVTANRSWSFATDETFRGPDPKVKPRKRRDG